MKDILKTWFNIGKKPNFIFYEIIDSILKTAGILYASTMAFGLIIFGMLGFATTGYSDTSLFEIIITIILMFAIGICILGGILSLFSTRLSILVAYTPLIYLSSVISSSSIMQNIIDEQNGRTYLSDYTKYTVYAVVIFIVILTAKFIKHKFFNNTEYVPSYLASKMYFLNIMYSPALLLLFIFSQIIIPSVTIRILASNIYLFISVGVTYLSFKYRVHAFNIVNDISDEEEGTIIDNNMIKNRKGLKWAILGFIVMLIMVLIPTVISFITLYNIE